MHVRQQRYRLLSEDVLLERLFGKDPSAAALAWREFLRRYSKLFLKVIWQFERDNDAVMEKYAFICSRLSENDFARLRAFEPTRRTPPTKLSTWLMIVAKNLCLLQHRVMHGQRRLPRALLDLSAFDQKVFMLYYWQGYSLPEIEHLMASTRRSEDPSVVEVMDRIEALALRPSRTWVNGAPRAFVSFDEEYHRRSDAPLPDLDRNDLAEALLAVLTPEEHVAVRLRFWDDLSAPEIAELLQGPTPRQVYTLLNRAMKKMRNRAEQDENATYRKPLDADNE